MDLMKEAADSMTGISATPSVNSVSRDASRLEFAVNIPGIEERKYHPVTIITSRMAVTPIMAYFSDDPCNPCLSHTVRKAAFLLFPNRPAKLSLLELSLPRVSTNFIESKKIDLLSGNNLFGLGFQHDTTEFAV